MKNPLQLLVALMVLVSVACGDDPVTTPGGDPLIYSGLLEQGERLQFPLILEKEGTIRIELTEARPIFIQLPPDGTVPLFTIGVGIGQLFEDDCQITFGSSLFVGDNLTILTEDTNKCLLIFDDGSLPPDALVEYEVTVDDVKS